MKRSAIVLRIESSPEGPLIRLRDEDLEKIGACVGEVLLLRPDGVEVRTMSIESEEQLRIGLHLLDEHRGVFEALAKT